MVVRIENGHEVPDPAIVPQYYAEIGHDGGTGVDKDPFAYYQGSIWASANLDRDRLAAQAQTSALDRSGREEHRAPPIHRDEGRSGTGQAENGRGP
jgi:hypothetical protein